MVQNAETIWRDFVTDGVPASGAHDPRKVEIREWAAWVETGALGGSAGAAVFASKSALDASLGYAANTMAWVLGDGAGIYQKTGASGSGSWVRRGDLPYSFVKLSNVGVGTANAIRLTSAMPTSQSAMRVANVFTANTGNVTISENGAAAKPLLTNSGNHIASGGLVPGMMLVYIDNGSSFRLLNDQVSAAIVAAAEAAQVGAVAARDEAVGAVPTLFVSTVAALQAVETATHVAAYLTLPGSTGQFVFRSGNYAQIAAAEPFNYVKANDTPLSAGAWVRDSATWGKTIIVLAMGQSNIDNHPDGSWSPPPNLYLWNGTFASPGTTIAPVLSTKLRVSYAHAAEIAKANPRDRVVIINIGRGSTAIANWLPGAPVIDMYAATKAAVEACLAYLGESQVHELLWWQGESDWFAEVGATYVKDWDTFFLRIIQESWFPRDTPISIYSVSHIHLTDPTLGKFNGMLRQIVRAEQQYRSFVDLSGLAPSYWDATNLHLAANGCLSAGILGYAASNRGKGVPRGSWQTLTKPANQTITNSVSTLDDLDLRTFVKAGSNVRIRGSIWFSSTIAAGFRYGFTGPAATFIYGLMRLRLNGVTTETDVTAAAYPAAVVTFPANGVAHLEFDLLIGNAQADNVLAFRWAQGVANAGTTRVSFGSYIEVMQV